MAFMSSQMPSDLKKNLVERFIGAFDGDSRLVDVNSTEQGARPFQSIHYSIYNRYTLKVSIDLSDLSFINRTL